MEVRHREAPEEKAIEVVVVEAVVLVAAQVTSLAVLVVLTKPSHKCRAIQVLGKFLLVVEVLLVRLVAGTVPLVVRQKAVAVAARIMVLLVEMVATAVRLVAVVAAVVAQTVMPMVATAAQVATLKSRFGYSDEMA